MLTILYTLSFEIKGWKASPRITAVTSGMGIPANDAPRIVIPVRNGPPVCYKSVTEAEAYYHWIPHFC